MRNCERVLPKRLARDLEAPWCALSGLTVFLITERRPSPVREDIDIVDSHETRRKTVAGGRSIAKTTGKRGNKSSTLKACEILAGMSGTLSACASESLVPGGLRCAPTTGYSLSTLRVAGLHFTMKLLPYCS